MNLPPWLHPFRRTFPSANMILVRGERPVLVDTGFGSDVGETGRLLRAAGVPPERLSLLVNTHWHCDHAGGNAGLQQRYGVPIAASRRDAGAINRRDPAACAAAWLGQPVEPYRVDRPLDEGDEVDAGGVVLRVLHTPGHTRGQIALYAPNDGVLLCGDAVHGDDVAWINPFGEGADALETALATLDQLARLPLRLAFSGHGPPIADPRGAIDAARRRYEGWRRDPHKLFWHACKRIFAYGLMLRGGLPAAAVAPYLFASPWFADYARSFDLEPAQFVEPLLAEMLRSRAAGWREGRLVALTPHNPPPADWHPDHTRPGDWPPPADPAS